MTENELLKSFIRQYSSSNRKIHNSSSIVEDLNIHGQKGIDFIQAYSTEFNVDITDFEINKYLQQTDESKNSPRGNKLTFGDLIKGIDAGKLNDDIIEFEDTDPNLPLKLTAKNIIMGILFIVVVSAVLSLMAIYI